MAQAEGKTMFLDCGGQSMRPLISAGDRLVVRPCAPDAVRVGDVLVFRYKGRLTGHRLIWKYRSGGRYLFWLRGDSSITVQRIGQGQLEGKVFSVVKPGRIVDLNGPAWRVLSPFLVVIGPLVYAVCRVLRPFRRRARA